VFSEVPVFQKTIPLRSNTAQSVIKRAWIVLLINCNAIEGSILQQRLCHWKGGIASLQDTEPFQFSQVEVDLVLVSTQVYVKIGTTRKKSRFGRRLKSVSRNLTRDNTLSSRLEIEVDGPALGKHYRSTLSSHLVSFPWQMVKRCSNPTVLVSHLFTWC
jgi:hypothetical protein